VCAELLRGTPGYAQRFWDAPRLLLCPIVEGELLYGALCSSAPEEGMQQVADLMSRGERLYLDHRTCIEFARVKRDLRQKGRMIPDNDIWVAACALAEGATLVTRDAHFREVEELAVEEW
jgi:tRNA(fMet)-specific endonuclease VapC